MRVATSQVQEQTWTYVAITCSGTDLELYLNGLLDATSGWGGVFTPRALGRSTSGFPDGALDEVRLWDIARSDAEILADYDQTVPPTSPGLIGYWQFDEMAGMQDVLDASPAGNDGTLGTDVGVASDDPVRFLPPP